MIDCQLREPVLVIGYNRPRYLAAVLDRIRDAAPERLYFAVDGPRADRPEDDADVQACRDLVANVDWPCEVHKLFRDRNLGCGAAVTAAITWFLDHEDRGLILEDDVVPDPSFFPFCAELLDRYQNDDRVLAVSGSNVVPRGHLSQPDLPYRFSQIPHIWGWAVWRRTWSQHRLDLGVWQDKLDAPTLWTRTGGSLTGTLVWAGTFEMVSQGLLDTWDVQLVFASMISGQWTATSNVNLTENIGSEAATHHPASQYITQPVGQARLPLDDVPLVLDAKADTWTRIQHFQASARARQALGLRSPRFRKFLEEVRHLSRGQRSV